MAKVIFDNFKIKNVKFEKKDALKLTYKKGSFNKIFCFDVIEHVPKTDANNLMKNMAKMLKKDGWLCLTTPNRREITGRIFGHKIIDKHYYEYTPKELRRMASPYFKNFKFIGIYLSIPPLPKIEHFSNILPCRYFFNAMIGLGYNHPKLAKTILLVAQKK